MSRQVLLSNKAKRDIEHALDWSLEQFGTAQHDVYLRLIQNALKRIESDPLEPPARARPELRKGLWTLHIGRRGQKARHLFAYRLRATGDVQVLRLLHDAMDLDRHL